MGNKSYITGERTDIGVFYLAENKPNIIKFMSTEGWMYCWVANTPGALEFIEVVWDKETEKEKTK